MSECTHNCESCGENCAERQMKPEDFLEKPHELSSVRKVVGVVSGKGGVGNPWSPRCWRCCSTGAATTPASWTPT